MQHPPAKRLAKSEFHSIVLITTFTFKRLFVCQVAPASDLALPNWLMIQHKSVYIVSTRIRKEQKVKDDMIRQPRKVELLLIKRENNVNRTQLRKQP